MLMRPWCAFGAEVYGIPHLTRERDNLASRTRPTRARWLHGRNTFLVVEGIMTDLIPPRR